MAGQYTVLKVLKCLSPPLLRDYLERRAKLPDLASMAEEARDSAKVWKIIPREKAQAVEADLRDVFDLADEKGIACLLDEAAFHGVDLKARFDGVEGLENRALVALLEHPSIFSVASLIRQADGLRGNSWARWAGFPTVSHVTAEMAEAIANDVGALFMKKEGRGLPCEAQRYLRHETHEYLFLFPADHARASLVYDESGKLLSRTSREAFEVVFVYDSAGGTLALWAKVDSRTKKKLRSVFSTVVFGQDIEALDQAATAYHLDALSRENAVFATDPADGIVQVIIKRIGLVPIGRYEKIILEAAGEGHDQAVASLIKRHLKGSPSSFFVQEVSLQFLLDARPGLRRQPQFTFDVHASGYSNLKSKPDRYRRLGEKYLERWGIDRAREKDAGPPPDAP